MCGIFFVQSKSDLKTLHSNGVEGIHSNFNSFEQRGPDRHELTYKRDKDIHTFIGFHRLAINGLDIKSDQPMMIETSLGRLYFVCNGEIYNYKQLATEFKIELTSGSDCEIIPRLFLKIGIRETIRRLDGVFAFVLHYNDRIYVGRDPIGVRPLFILWGTHSVVLSSVASGCMGFNIQGSVKQVYPGTLTEMNISGKDATSEIYYWWKLPKVVEQPTLENQDLSVVIRKQLIQATQKRLMSDRPIGCLLSGGLDSSVIASILSHQIPNLQTFSIGFSTDSTDLKAARKVAQHLGTVHNEVIIPYSKALESIPRVIQSLETFDITTIRASVGMFLLSEWIKKNSDVIVLYSGEGSDELFCGYLYFHGAPNFVSLERESRRLLDELHLYDVLRADRTTASHGLELRVPFLDKHLIELVVKLPGKYRHPHQPNEERKQMEKLLLRKAFAEDLPESIVWRRKEGFSDGVSSLERSWYTVIQEHVESLISDIELEAVKGQENYLTPITKESIWYKKIFDEKFPKFQNPIKKYWMPQWTDTNDPSGRVTNAFDEK